MSKLVNNLYKAARKANDLETLASGNPKRIGKRVKNKYLSRKLLKWLFK